MAFLTNRGASGWARCLSWWRWRRNVVPPGNAMLISAIRQCCQAQARWGSNAAEANLAVAQAALRSQLLLAVLRGTVLGTSKSLVSFFEGNPPHEYSMLVGRSQGGSVTIVAAADSWGLKWMLRDVWTTGTLTWLMTNGVDVLRAVTDAGDRSLLLIAGKEPAIVQLSRGLIQQALQ